MKVGVIGAGTMGSGIAQAFAQCAEVEKVYLCDIKQEFADGGCAKIAKSINNRMDFGSFASATHADRLSCATPSGSRCVLMDMDIATINHHGFEI